MRAQKPEAQSLRRPPDGTAEAEKVKLWLDTHTEAQLSSIAAVVSFTLLTGTEKQVMSLAAGTPSFSLAPLIATAIPAPPTAGIHCPLGAGHVAMSASAEANRDISAAMTHAGHPPTEALLLKRANSAGAGEGCWTKNLRRTPHAGLVVQAPYSPVGHQSPPVVPRGKVLF